MSDWVVGLSTGCFYRRSIFDVLEIIQNGGFTTIEICSFPDHLDYHDTISVNRAAKLIQHLGMVPFSFHAPFASWIDITSLDDEQHRKSVNEIIKAAEAAAALDVRYFVIHPGPEKEDKPPAEELMKRMEKAVIALDHLAQKCYQLGICLTLENLLPHLLFGRTRDVLWIIGAAQQTNVCACLDTGHAYLASDLNSSVHKLSGHLKMIHATDNNKTYDDHLPPGMGSIDWKGFIDELVKHQFSGAFILELSGDRNIPADQLMTEARQARNLILKTD